MFYTIYKITNQINGKFYIGRHKTKDLNDSYMGSGKYLKHAQAKYGIENFKKEILFVFDTTEEMYAKEAEIVNEEFLAEENTYNVKVGGYGGWDYINESRSPEEWSALGKNGAKYSSKNKNSPRTKEWRENLSRSLKGKQPFLGKMHSDETKEKISKANSILQSGEGNSQFGTMWITDGVISKKISKNDPIPDGWRTGRIQKMKSAGE